MDTHAPSYGNAPGRLRRAARWLRWATLLVALLAFVLQQRPRLSVLRLAAPETHVFSERAQHVESHALRAEPALRVELAPVFARVPWFPAGLTLRPWPAAGCQATEIAACPLAQASSHFHSKRRIPRMNSEEPPRA